MWHQLLGSASFHHQLLAIDADLAGRAGTSGCPECGSALHQANYPRKPRGGPREASRPFDRRHSFCCSGRDCRKRLTPTSVRFLDRRVYLSVVVVLACVVTEGVTGSRVQTLRQTLNIDVDPRTLERWRTFWREEVPRTGWWTEMRGRLGRPLSPETLPGSLLALVCGDDARDRLVRFLRLLAPPSHSRLMRQRFARVA